MELLLGIIGLFVMAAAWGLVTRALDDRPVNRR
jgi:hypothetical protein